MTGPGKKAKTEPPEQVVPGPVTRSKVSATTEKRKKKEEEEEERKKREKKRRKEEEMERKRIE